jgi:flagellar protein FliO/FliZ
VDSLEILRLIAALMLVIGLIAGLGYAARRSGLPQKWMGGGKVSGRLSVLEVRYLDARRKLVLVKRDQQEHLLLLGDGHAIVVESGIRAHD